MKIEVTELDIRRGKIRDCARCPVALAIRRKLKGAEVGVYTTYAKNRLIHLPRLVSDWILRFDNMRPVTPFAFELKVS